jgi:hypothetical protein
MKGAELNAAPMMEMPGGKNWRAVHWDSVRERGDAPPGKIDEGQFDANSRAGNTLICLPFQSSERCGPMSRRHWKQTSPNFWQPVRPLLHPSFPLHVHSLHISFSLALSLALDTAYGFTSTRSGTQGRPSRDCEKDGCQGSQQEEEAYGRTQRQQAYECALVGKGMSALSNLYRVIV